METLITVALSVVILVGCAYNVRTWLADAEQRGYERGRREGRTDA